VTDGSGCVRTIVPSTRGGADGLLYVGTTNNSVLHGSLQDKLSTVIHVSIHCFNSDMLILPFFGSADPSLISHVFFVFFSLFLFVLVPLTDSVAVETKLVPGAS